MYCYSKDKLYVLACSFGPDSMALFDILEKEGYRFVVAHINYHKRDISDFEEESLRNYCKKRQIPFFLLDTKNLKVKGNFQSWARTVRYDFFSKVYQKISANGLFVAHNLDDLLETYLMQKERRSSHDYYGLPSSTKINKMRVLRPLLNVRKKDLLEYCKKQGVPFSIDVSNLSDDYRRNQIRHHFVEKLSDKEIKLLKDEIKAKNRQNVDNLSLVQKYVTYNSLQLSFIKDEKAPTILRLYLKKIFPSYPASNKFIDESLKAFRSSKSYVEIPLKGNIRLIKDYEMVKVINFDDFKDYIYCMDCPKKLDIPHLVIDFSKNNLPKRIQREDFPIYIRNIRPNDSVTIGQNNKMVSHLFSEWKMPHDLRRFWPIFLNKHHQIIYIPRYREHYDEPKEANLTIKKSKL